jgi:hypothetical protein
MHTKDSKYVFLFPQLPLDTGTWILHLSGIRWMFFIFLSCCLATFCHAF